MAVGIKSGHVFHGPNGQGYTLVKSLSVGDVITVDHFKPFGGAPKLRAQEVVPSFLDEALRKIQQSEN